MRTVSWPRGDLVVHRYRQTHRGLDVLGGELILVTAGNRVIGGSNRLVADLDVELGRRITADSAQRLARRAATDRSQLTVEIHATREVIVRARDGYHAVWRVELVNGFVVTVDRGSGEVLSFVDGRRRQQFQDADLEGPTHHHGRREFRGQVQPLTGTHRLIAAEDPSVLTLDATAFPAVIHITYDGAMFPASLIFETSVHWAGQMAVEYFASVHGNVGLDGEGAPLEFALDHPDYIGIGAAWIPGDDVVVLETDGSFFDAAPTRLDFIGHEVVHGVQFGRVGNGDGFDQGPGFFEFYEPLSLGEAFADLFGELIERYVTGSIDWVIGNGIFLQGETRRIDAPHLAVPPQPAVYQGLHWKTTGQVTLPGHHNSSVITHTFYRIAEGDSVVTQPIGIDLAERLYFQGMTLMSFDETFSQARQSMELAAILLHGEHSRSHSVVQQAWGAAGLGNPFVDLRYEPVDREIDVDPWPVELQWQPATNETEWQVEIAENPDFNLPIIERATSEVVEVAGEDTVVLPPREPPYLRPATTYYWRVRGFDSVTQSWNDWRLTHHFVTADKAPTTITPGFEKTYHPWRLPFEWLEVEGAESYTLEVFEQDPISGEVDFDLPLSTEHPLRSTETVLDLRVDQAYVWRVRANGPSDDVADNSGIWTAQGFFTSLPRVTLLSPLDGEPRYPWPTELSWRMVRGASLYLIDLTQQDGVFSLDGSIEPIEVDPEPIQRSYTYPIHVEPHWLHDNVHHWWRVRVIGPEPWLEEGGLPLQNGDWTVDGADTVPKQVDPPWSINPYACFGLDDDITFTWEGVQGATSFQLSLAYALADALPPSYDIGKDATVLELDPLPADPIIQSYSQTSNSPAMDGGDRHLGYFWSVRATGPDGLLGLEGLGSPFMVEQTRPEIIHPELEFGMKEDVVVAWETEHAPFAGFKFRFYESKACAVDKKLWDDHVDGVSPGRTRLELTGLDPDTWYSYRVTPQYVIGHSTCEQATLWSDCGRVRHLGPVCGNDEKEGGEECDDGNTVSGDGCSSGCKDDVACDQTITNGGDSGLHNKAVGLGNTNPGTFWFSWNTVDIPDEISIRYGTTELHSTGCVGSAGGIEIAVPGGFDHIFVTVNPNCNGNTTGTQWAFLVECLDGGGNSATANPE
ncbi:MAG: M4 family metallopeptidase [Acidobacteriota bacterium]